MSAVPSKQKALLLHEKGRSVVVHDFDVPKPGPGELLVENHSVALNPVDWANHDLGLFVREWPAIFGLDGAGLVKQVGEGVTDFSVGDRVLYCGEFTNRQGAFQEYTIANTFAAAKLPENLTYDEGAALPIVLNTAAFGLYGKVPGRGGLLTAPYEQGGLGKYVGQALLVTSGASGVGQQVIQLAKLSGFSTIIATASLRNEAYLKSLGATHVIDRNAPLLESVQGITSHVDVVFDAVAAAETQFPGYEAVAPGGTFIVAHPELLLVPKEKLDPSKTIAHIYCSPHEPAQKEDAIKLWGNITPFLERGQLKANRIEVIPGGLGGIREGLLRLKNGQASAVKYVVHPRET